MTDARLDPTPVLITRSVIRRVPGSGSPRQVTLHSPTDPCGHITRTDRSEPVRTFRTFVANWLEDRPVRLTTCDSCGGSL